MEGSLWLTLMATCMVLKYSHSISDYEEGLPFDLGCGNSMDIALMLDTTTNNPSQHDEFRKFLTDLVDEFQIDSGKVRVALVTFSSQPVLHFRLDKYTNKNDIKSAIRNARFTPGERNFADAFDMLRRQVFFGQYGDRFDAPNIVILITSGNSQRKEIEAAQQAHTLKDQASILVIPKGVSNLKEMQSFASDPYLENTYELGASENISLIKDLVYVGICSITTDNAYDNEEFEGSAVSSTVSNKTDLAILLHYSDTTPKKEFDAIQQFLHDLLANVNVDNDNVRVSLALYGRETNLQFDFNAYKQNKKKLLNALLIDYFDGRSQEANLARALDFARTSMFLEAYGDRVDVPNTLLVITNKNSDGNYVPAFQQSLEELKNTDVTVIGVGLNLYDVDEVNALTKSPAFSFILNDASQLSVVLKEIQKRLPSLTPIETTPAASPIVFYEEPIQNTSVEAGIDSNVKADITVVFHSSHKTKAKLFKKKLLNFISNLFAKAAVDSGDVKVAMVNYGVTGTVLFNFNKYTQKSELRKAIRNTSGKVRNSNANLGDALHLIRTKLFTKQEGFRVDEGVSSAIILITDMPSTVSSYSVEDEMNRIKRDFKTSVFTVGIDKADLKELQTITSTPTRDYFQSVTNYEDLMANKDILANIRNGIRPLGSRAAKTSKPTSMQGQNTEPWIAPTLNLAILFQSHGKTNPKDFYKRLLPFIGNLIQYPDLSKHRTDVALFNYGKTVNILKQFKGSESLNETKSILLGLSKTLRSKSAILCKALDEALTSFQKLGNVALVSNQIVIITDTQTTDNCTAVIDKLQSSDVDVQAIQVKTSEDNELKLITDPKEGGFLLSVKSYEDLIAQSQILDAVAQNIIYNVDTKTLRSKTLRKNDGEKGRPAKIVILLHASTNVSKRNFKKQFLKYVLKLVKKAKIGVNDVRVSLIAYGDKPYVVFNFNDHLDKKTLLRAIKKTPKKLRFDSADLGKGIASARLIFDNDKLLQGEQILIIVTDVNPTGDHSVLQSEVSTAKHEGIQISVVSVAISNTTILKNVASRPTSKHFYNVKTYTDLQIYQKSGKPVIRNIPFLRKKKKRKPKPPVSATSTMTPWSTADKFLATTISIKHTLESKSTPKIKTTPFQMNQTNEIGTLDNSSRPDFSDSSQVNHLITSTDSTDYQWITDKSTIKQTIDDLEKDKSTIPYDVYYTVSYGDKTQTSNNISVNTTENNETTVHPNITVPEDHTTAQLKTSTLPTNWNIITRRDQFNTDRFSNTTRDPTNNRIDEDGYQKGAFSTTYASASKDYETYEHLSGGKKVVKNFTEGLSISPTIGSYVGIFNKYTPTNGNINSNNKTDWFESTLTPPENDSSKGENVMERADFLKAQNRDLLRNGQKAQIVFAFHVSSSILESEAALLKQFYTDILHKGDIESGGLKVAIIGYGDVATTYADFSRPLSRRDLISTFDYAIDKEKISVGNRNVNAASVFDEVARILPAGNDIPKALIFFTDQQSTDIANLADNVMKKKLEDEELVEIFSVAVGTNSKDEPAALASTPENVFSVSEYSSLPRISEEFVQRLGIFRSLTEESIPDLKDAMISTTPPQQKYDIENPTTLIPTTFASTAYSLPVCFDHADVVFALDSSISIQSTGFRKMLNFCKQFLDKLSIDNGAVRVGIVTFSSRYTIEFNLNKYSSVRSLQQAIDGMQWSPSFTKNTAEGIKAMHKYMFTSVNGDRPKASNIAIIITKGPSVDSQRTLQEALTAKSKGIHIYAVGIGLDEDLQSEVNSIASEPFRKYSFFISSFDQLDGLDDEIVASADCPENIFSDNYDVVFLLDSFGVTRSVFEDMKTFVYQIIDYFNINYGQYKVGLAQYTQGDDITAEWHLNSYKTKQDILSAAFAVNFKQRSGKREIGKGIDYIRTNMFKTENGDRIFGRDLIILLTGMEKSEDVYQSYLAAERAEDAKINLYTVGFYLNDTEELRQISTWPLRSYNYLVKNYDDVGVLPAALFNSIQEDIEPRRQRPRPTVDAVEPSASPPKEAATYTPFPTTVLNQCFSKVDLVFVLDSSTSVGNDNYDKMKSFVTKFLHSANIDNGDVRVGLLSYSTQVTVEFKLNSYTTKTDVFNAVNAIPWRYGSTNTADGIQTMHEELFNEANGDRPGVPNICIIMTDGVSNINYQRTIPEAETARAKGIHIYAVGIALKDLEEVNGIASKPESTNVFAVNTFDELEGLDEKIFESTCPATTTTTPLRDSGYDVVIMMDSNVAPETFDSMKKYTKSLVNKFSIDDKEYRVGLMQYGSSNNKQWDLNRYDDKYDVLSAVDRVPFRRDTSSDAASAIRMVRRRMFNDRNGDRDFARNLIFLMTANERSDDIYATWNEAEEAEKENINLYTVGFDLNDTTEIDETSTHPLRIYRHLINTREGDRPIDESTSNILGLIDEDIEPPRSRPKPTTTPIPTTVINQCFAQVDLVFILDSSTSVGNDNYDKMKSFVTKFLHDANIDSGDVRVGLLSYSTKVTVEFKLNSYSTKADVFDAVNAIPWRYGSTNTADGLQTMHEELFNEANGDRPGVPNICIIMTDGVSNINYRRTIPEADVAKEKGIHIYAVGIALKDLKEVNGIASEPASTNVFAVNTFDELEGLDEKIFAATCTVSTPTARPLPTGYDVVLLLDSSVPQETYQFMKDYAKNLVNGFDVENEDYRVGLMRYSTDADVQFDLNEYSTRDSLKLAIDKSTYKPGNTDTAKAINSVRENMFREPRGDRNFARNLIFLLTGQDKSDDTFDAWAAAQKAEAEGINLFTVGINLNDTMELDELSTHPIKTYRQLINTYQPPAELNRTLSEILGRIDDNVEPERPRKGPTGGKPDCGFDNVDLVFIVDSSTSVGQENFRKILDFLKDFLGKSNIDSGSVRVGVLSYSTEVHDHFYLNSYQTSRDMFSAIDNISWIYGSTNTADAIRDMRTKYFSYRNGDRPNARNIAFIITDGVSNINQNRLEDEVNLAKEEGIQIYAVGIGLSDDTEINLIASPPSSEHVYSVRNFDELRNLDERIYESLCPSSTTILTRPPTTTSTTTSPTPTRRRITTTTVATTTERTTGYDVVLVLDSSVDRSTFDFMKRYAKDLVDNLSIDNNEYRVGVMRYSTNPDVQFNLDRYDQKQFMKNRIDYIQYRSGKRNTDRALDAVRQRMFTPRNGDRDYARNLIVHITGNDESSDIYDTWAAAERAERDDINIYTVGINLGDLTEINELSTHPLSTYRTLINTTMGRPEIDDSLLGLVRTIDDNVEPLRLRPKRTTTTSTTPPTTTPRTTGKDVIFMLDSSVPPAIFNWMKSYVSNMVKKMSIDDEEYKVGLMKFGTYQTPAAQLNANRDKNDVLRKVDRMSYSPGRTNTDAAIDYVRRSMFTSYNGDRNFARNIVVLLTSNEKSYNTERTLDAAERAEENGINLFTVGINLNDTEEIDEISTHPLSTYRHLVNTNMNSQMMDDSANEILGLVTEIIEPSRKRIRPTTSPPTTTPTTQIPLGGQDIVVVMDSSVKPGRFRTFKTFVQRLAENLNIDSGEVRLGLVSYSTRPSLQWNLRDFNRKDQIINRAERITYNAGQRNTADAINFARTRMFVRSNGDRSYARNFIILLTGEKESLDRYDAYEAAYEAERDGINLFTIGYNLNDTAEISEISTYPLRTYRHLVSEESELLELPGVLQYTLNDMGENSEPARQRPKRPTTLPPPTTTRKPGDCKGKGDVVFILDTSGSVGRDGFYKVLNFTYQAISDLDIDSGNFRVAVITFSNWPRLEFDLSDYTTKSEIEKALTRVQYVYGNTNTASALRMAREQVFVQTRGDRVGAPNVVISITDGESNINADDTIPEALLLKRTGTTLLTVAVGYTHREEELVGLTSPPVKENLFRVENFDALHNFGATLVNPLCNDANKCASKPCQNGAFCIDGIGSYQCVCTNGFHGQNCDKKCGDPADVVFVMDSSEGIGEYTFGRIKGYVDYLVRQMNVEECDIRVGAMKYSSSPMVQFNIGQYQDTNTITRMVDHIGYTKGKANMAGAFRSLRTNMFNGNGDRPSVKNVAYLITDGSVGVNEDITLQEAELAIESDIQIIPIAIQMRRREEIENIALSQGLKTMEIDDETQLYSMKDDVLEPIFESVDYCADSPCRNGGQCKNNNGGFLCECRPGFSGDVCQKRCPSTGDVVFVVDASRHVNRRELRDMRKFIKQLVRRMTFRKNGFRVGVVQFAGSALVRLDLQKGSRKKAVMSAVSGIRRSGSDPMPMEALQKTRLRIFGRAGDRKDVPNTVIFITKSMRKESEIMREAGKLKLEGTSIIGIGMDLSDSDKNFLETAVSPPVVANAFFLPDGETLTSLTDTIMSYLCNENTACSDNPCQNNGTCTSLSSTEYTCSCTKGYAGKNCEEVNGNVADIAFLVDASGSVGLDNVDKMKEFVYSVVEKLSIGWTDDRVGLVSYSSDPQLGFHLDSFFTKKDINNAISAMQYRYGSTNTAAGLKMVRQEIFNIRNGDRPNVPNTLILITDGNSNVNSIDTIPEAIRLREAGVHIFVIAINIAGDMYRQEMDDIASQPPDQNVFWVNSFSELPEVGSAVFNKLSSPDMNKGICDTNEIKCKHGGRCVATAVTGSFRCECIQGFTGEFCEIACPSRFDVAFVIDSSVSVGPHNFGLIRNFSSSVIEKLYQISRNNKFAMITFNSEANVAFSFGRNSDLNGLKSAIAGVRYKPGGTNTALALRTAYGLLQNDYGARRSAQDVVILVTDEASNIDAQETLPAAKELKDAGTHVIAIGMDLDTAGRAAAQEVKDIASSDDRAMIKLNSYSALKGVENDVINQMCEFGRNGRK